MCYLILNHFRHRVTAAGNPFVWSTNPLLIQRLVSYNFSPSQGQAGHLVAMSTLWLIKADWDINERTNWQLGPLEPHWSESEAWQYDFRLVIERNKANMRELTQMYKIGVYVP